MLTANGEVDLGELSSRWKLPPALVKSCFDEFDYALGLRDGTIIYFSYAEFDTEVPEWVHLIEHPMYEEAYANRLGRRRLPVSFLRGLDVRLTEIAWVADAPFGS